MKHPLQFLAIFVTGAIIGGALLLAIKSHDIDMLYYQLAQMRLQYHEVLQENVQLKSDLRKQADNRITRVRKLDIRINTTDESLNLKLQQYIQNLSKFLVGRPLQAFEQQPDLIQHLLNGRTVVVDNKTYVLHVDAVVIMETLHIWLHLESKP